MAKRKKWTSVDWVWAPDIKKRVNLIVKKAKFEWIDPKRIFCLRSTKSASRARARIWSLPRVWQISLSIEPAYVIEVLSQRFDNLSQKEKDEVILHELAHIPKNFSGSLIPHIKKRGKRNFYQKVDELIKIYSKNSI
jgi:predicted metallopeptidase